MRLRDPVALPVHVAEPAPVKVAVSGGGGSDRAARRAESKTRIFGKLLGTRGASRSRVVEQVWDPDARDAGVGDALYEAVATGTPTAGTRGGTADDGPTDGGTLGRIGGASVDLGRVEATVGLETRTVAAPDRAAAC